MDIVRYWKDPEYRRGVPADEAASAPEHPSGAVELNEHALAQVVGARTEQIGTAGCCGGFSSDNRCGTSPAACAPTQSQYTCSGAACK